MKFQSNRLLSLAILGSLFALSCTYTGKVQAARSKRSRQMSAPRMQSETSFKKSSTGQNQPVHVKSMEELNKHLTAGKPIVLMIHATWCGACKVSMEPFADAAEDNQHVQFLIVEGSKEVPGVAEKYSIRGFPTFVLFDAAGNEVHKFSGGGWPKSVMNQKIKEHIK